MLLPVDGSARTLIWVEVVPSTGAAVSWGGGGRAVCGEVDFGLTDNVAVTRKAVGAVALAPSE